MKAKGLFIIILSLFIFMNYADAENTQKPIYSKVSTSFYLSKTIKCDIVKAKFEVYAEGDNYNTALKRLTKINNNFIQSLKKVLPSKDIQTSNAYGYSKTARLYISINSRKIDKIPEILRYIANENFQYKTGIRPIYIRFNISDELRKKVKNALFTEALNESEKKLEIVNSSLGNGYKLNSINIGSNAEHAILFNRENLSRTLYKSSQNGVLKNNSLKLQTSPGSITIKSNIRLQMIKKID